MSRTSSYCFTVRMINGKVALEDEQRLSDLRAHISVTNKMGWGKKYIKLQGRLGTDNQNSWKYRGRFNGGIYPSSQCVRLKDAATADVYIYNR